jgi:hypothetical protein
VSKVFSSHAVSVDGEGEFGRDPGDAPMLFDFEVAR